MRIALPALASMVAIVFAGSASAQDTSTNCRQIGNTWNCNTHSSPTVDWGVLTRGPSVSDVVNQAVERQRQQNEARQREELASQERSRLDQQDAYANLSRTVHQGVGDYLKEGRCQDAVDMALKYGEIELATQAKAFCAASPAPPPHN